MNLPTRLDELAALQPNKPALIYADRRGQWQTITYSQLADSTNRFFLSLQHFPLTPGMSVALMIPPSVDFFPFAFALLKFGIVPIILDPAIGLKKVGECLKESKPDIFIGNALTHTLRIALGWGKESVKCNLSLEKLKRKKVDRGGWSKVKSQTSSSNDQPLHPFAVIYTSGSTGLPKGAIYTQENFVSQLDLLQKTFNIKSDEIDLPAFPLYALIDVLLGVTSVIPDISFPAPGKTDAQKVIQAIQRFGVTNMFASPIVLEILASQEKKIELHSLKRVITAGAPATIDLQKRFRNLLAEHTDLFGIYGATESLPIAKIESREIFALKVKTENGAGICLGKPLDGVTVKTIGISEFAISEWQDALEVASNVIGEIAVQSKATTQGYIQREDANRLSKIRKGEEIIHRTGDVGYFDDGGRLWYCGRKLHRVISDGGVMFTEQIENIFNAHPQVNRTALVGVNGMPVLWVELKKGAKNKDTIKGALKLLALNHSQASQIERFLFIAKLPTDVRHNSKIIREKLTNLARSSSFIL